MHALTSDTAQKMHDYWAILGVQREGSTDTTLRLTATEIRDYSDAIRSRREPSWKPFFFCSLPPAGDGEQGSDSGRGSKRSARTRGPGARRRCRLVDLFGRVLDRVLPGGQFFDFVVDPKTAKPTLRGS
jgi:hypothetical protein